MASTPRPWSIHEDSLLRQAVADYGEVWRTVALCVPGRSNKACRKRWLHSLSPTLRKTPWTPFEDALLLELVAANSPPRWSVIARSIPGRTDDACSKRYREALDPLLKKDDWTAEEDARLLHLTTQLGSKWTQVGQAMGRSGLGCRNRWRLLERKQRPRTAAPSAVPEEPPHDLVLYAHDDYYVSDHLASAYHPGPSARVHASTATSFPDTVAPQSSSLILPLPASSISTDSSLSGALASPPSFRDSHPDPSTSVSINTNCISPADDAFDVLQPPPSPADSDILTPENLDSCPIVVPSSLPEHPGADPGSPNPGPDEVRTALPARKRPKPGRPSCAEQSEHTRLSSHLPADLDPNVLAYACGHSACWPDSSGPGTSCFATASQLAEHRRVAHAGWDAPNPGGKPYRCALQGCGKGWKNINGIQYHLQISKAHFKAALSLTRGPSDPVAAPSEVTDGDGCVSESVKERRLGTNTRKRKEHRCPHEGCTNIYKQRTGLQYHLAHGHPANMAQLGAIPPVLMRKVSAG